MINFEEFIQEYYPSVDESKKNWTRLVLSNIEELTKDISLEEALKDKTLVCKMFIIKKTSEVSRPQYHKIKRCLLDLVDYLNITANIPSRDEILSTQGALSYFKDLDDLISFIDDIGYEYMPNYNKKTDLCTIKSLAILGWHGLSPEQISRIKQTDCNFGSKLNTIKNTEVDLILNEKEAAILSVLKNSDSFRGYPNGKIIYYKKGFEYLFKTPYTTTAVPLDKITLLHNFIRFNKKNNSYKSLLFGSLKKNAIFVDIYNDKRNIPLSIKITERFKCDRFFALGVSKEYKKWVEIYNK